MPRNYTAQDVDANVVMVGKEIICDPRATKISGALRKISSGEWSISSSCNKDGCASKECLTPRPNTPVSFQNQEHRPSISANVKLTDSVLQQILPHLSLDTISLADTSVSALTDSSSEDSSECSVDPVNVTKPAKQEMDAEAADTAPCGTHASGLGNIAMEIVNHLSNVMFGCNACEGALDDSNVNETVRTTGGTKETKRAKSNSSSFVPEGIVT